MIGNLLGHYRILELLGTGGMGQVYLAEDTRLQRRVALKVLAKELALDPDRRERFEREARAAAALNHPNIVTIHSVEEAEGTPFLTLELIDGQTLGDLISPEGLPLDRVLDLGIPLADAVGAAHQRGITHRDLKPANIMLTRDGRLKVLDFGLAKLKEDARLIAEAGMPTAGLTGEGRIVGTVAYMSPEQAEGKPVDQRSDVFSLGVILYEMATGDRPFRGETHMSILSAIIKDTPPSVSEIRRGLPRELAKIVNRCLAKDVEDRYQSAKDLRNDLRALKNDLTSGEIVPITRSSETVAAVAPRRSWRTAGIAAAGVLLLAAVGVGLFMWSRAQGAPAASALRPFDTINLTRLTTSGTAGSAAMSSDGRYVAHVSAKGGQQSLWLRQVATTSNVEIVPPADVRYDGVSFSPDGNHIYYTAYPRVGNIALLYQVPVLGGGARLILEDIDSAVSFSPDGKQFAFLRGLADNASSLMIANADGSQPRTVVTRKRPKQFSLDGVAWSPDGLRVAASGGDGALRGEIVLVEVATGTEQVLPTPDWRQVTGLAWLPDGLSLLANAQESAAESSSQIFLVSYPSGSARRITNDLTTYSGLGIAPDGRSFVCIRNERRASIWTMPLTDASKAVAVSAEAGPDDGVHGIAWSPDGRIVYTTEASGNPDIWIMNADGSRRVQLTAAKGQDMSPRVTADGKYIVFVSDRDGGLRAWRMGLDGSGSMRLASDQIARSRVALSADSQWVYYSDFSGDARRVSIDGGTPVSLFSAETVKDLGEPLPPDFHEPMPSPDGAHIAGHYADPASRGERIVLIALKGGGMKRFPAVPAFSIFAPDGRSFVYLDTRVGVSNLVRYPIAGGAAVPLTKFTSEQIFNYALAPDQRSAALVRGRVASDVVLISTGTR